MIDNKSAQLNVLNFLGNYLRSKCRSLSQNLSFRNSFSTPDKDNNPIKLYFIGC